jgi:dTDP-4-amino-4,6-dideoxygalactose transaminase
LTVQLFDTETPISPLRDEILKRIQSVVEGGRFILGPEVAAFESELASYLGVKHVIGVGNGTDALTIATRAAGIEPGDEVIVPSFTFYATAEAIAAFGARPVFADVDPLTRNLSVETIAKAMTPNTRAIVVVDLFGLPAPVAEIKEAFDVPVIEDAAQAIGARVAGVNVGAAADAATFSFYPSKNLGAFGDGGAIATNDDQLAAIARSLRFHGSKDKTTFEYVGYNSRLDEIQAAVLRVLLPHIDGWCDGRRAGAQAYVEAGLGEQLQLPQLLDGIDPAWHLYVAQDDAADARIAQLNAAGVEARAYYRVPLHRQPAMEPFTGGNGKALELPVTDELARTIIALPISPVFGREQADAVVAALTAADQ